MKLRELTLDEKNDVLNNSYRISRFIKDIVYCFNSTTNVGFNKNKRFKAKIDKNENQYIYFKTGILFSKYVIKLFDIKDYYHNLKDTKDTVIVDYLNNLIHKIIDARFTIQLNHNKDNLSVMMILNKSDLKYI